jgi:hypothetical protein
MSYRTSYPSRSRANAFRFSFESQRPKDLPRDVERATVAAHENAEAVGRRVDDALTTVALSTVEAFREAGFSEELADRVAAAAMRAAGDVLLQEDRL